MIRPSYNPFVDYNYAVVKVNGFDIVLPPFTHFVRMIPAVDMINQRLTYLNESTFPSKSTAKQPWPIGSVKIFSEIDSTYDKRGNNTSSDAF